MSAESGDWFSKVPCCTDEVQGLLVKYPNLVMCITTFNLTGCTNALSHESLATLIEEYPTRFVVSTDAAGQGRAASGHQSTFQLNLSRFVEGCHSK